MAQSRPYPWVKQDREELAEEAFNERQIMLSVLARQALRKSEPVVVGFTSVSGNVLLLPPGALLGDLAVLVTGRQNSAGPAAIVGWTDYGVVGGANPQPHGQRLQTKILTEGDVTTGTITSDVVTVQMGVLVLRHAAGIAGTNQSGQYTNETAASAALPARTRGEGACIVAMVTHRTQDDPGLKTRQVPGYSTQSADGASEMVGAWMSIFVSTTAQTFPVDGGANVGRTMEIAPIG